MFKSLFCLGSPINYIVSKEKPKEGKIFVFTEQPLTEVIIDLNYGSREPRYVAQLIWMTLFQFYRKGGGDLDRPFEMLCDLYLIERWTTLDRRNNPTFWWSFGNYPTGTFTDVLYYHNPFQDSYSVSFKDEMTIVIEFIPGVEEEE